MKPKGRRMVELQPVHLTYNIEAAGPGQPIPVVNRAVGGEGLKIWFNWDKEDRFYHHSNNGGPQIVNGAGNAAGYDAHGVVSLWIVDLWGPDAEHLTEFQMWISLGEILSNGSTGATKWSSLAGEEYAPIQHDDHAWEPDGDIQVEYSDDHDESVKHHMFTIPPVFVPSNRRLRVHIAQFHGDEDVPGLGLPYPGYIHRATCDLHVFPR